MNGQNLEYNHKKFRRLCLSEKNNLVYMKNRINRIIQEDH